MRPAQTSLPAQIYFSINLLTPPLIVYTSHIQNINQISSQNSELVKFQRILPYQASLNDCGNQSHRIHQHHSVECGNSIRREWNVANFSSSLRVSKLKTHFFLVHIPIRCSWRQINSAQWWQHPQQRYQNQQQQYLSEGSSHWKHIHRNMMEIPLHNRQTRMSNHKTKKTVKRTWQHW